MAREVVFDLDAAAFSSNDFRMNQFKARACSVCLEGVKRCPRARPHDWTQCPFAHPGEKAKRRDPRRYRYSGTACPEFRRNGCCRRGDACPFAHGVFECWLHPSRYRTQMCTDGTSCKRRVCFFAHTDSELRKPEEDPVWLQQQLQAELAAEQQVQNQIQTLKVFANMSNSPSSPGGGGGSMDHSRGMMSGHGLGGQLSHGGMGGQEGGGSLEDPRGLKLLAQQMGGNADSPGISSGSTTAMLQLLSMIERQQPGTGPLQQQQLQQQMQQKQQQQQQLAAPLAHAGGGASAQQQQQAAALASLLGGAGHLDGGGGGGTSAQEMQYKLVQQLLQPNMGGSSGGGGRLQQQQHGGHAEVAQQQQHKPAPAANQMSSALEMLNMLAQQQRQQQAEQQQRQQLAEQQQRQQQQQQQQQQPPSPQGLTAALQQLSLAAGLDGSRESLSMLAAALGGGSALTQSAPSTPSPDPQQQQQLQQLLPPLQSLSPSSPMQPHSQGSGSGGGNSPFATTPSPAAGAPPDMTAALSALLQQSGLLGGQQLTPGHVAAIQALLSQQGSSPQLSSLQASPQPDPAMAGHRRSAGGGGGGHSGGGGRLRGVVEENEDDGGSASGTPGSQAASERSAADDGSPGGVAAVATVGGHPLTRVWSELSGQQAKALLESLSLLNKGGGGAGDVPAPSAPSSLGDHDMGRHASFDKILSELPRSMSDIGAGAGGGNL